MTAIAEGASAKPKRSMHDRLANLSGYALIAVGLSALGSGIEGTADAYLRTISIACLAMTLAVVSLALRAAKNDR